MADSLCGPSNALKRLGDHTNVDRSAHLDRFAKAGPAPASFRSTPHPTAGGDQAFESFQAGGVPLSLDAQAHGGFSGLPAMVGGPGPAGAFVNLPMHSPAAIAAQPGWASEFRSTMNAGMPVSLAHSAHTPASAMPSLSAATSGPVHSNMHVAPAQRMPLYQPHFGSNVMPMHPVGGYASNLAGTMTPTAHLQQMKPPEAATAVAADVPVFSDEQMEAAFAAYDDKDEFVREMDAWMAEHGPKHMSQEDLDAEAHTHLADLAAEMDLRDLEAHGAALGHSEEGRREDEQLQQEQHERDEFRKAAQDIVSSIGNMEKFRASHFVELMRKITDGQVILDKGQNDLVDANTMVPLTASQTDGFSGTGAGAGAGVANEKAAEPLGTADVKGKGKELEALPTGAAAVSSSSAHGPPAH